MNEALTSAAETAQTTSAILESGAIMLGAALVFVTLFRKLKLGPLIGFCAGFPLSLSTASLSPMTRNIPLWWCLDLWVGACVSALISGWLYRD